MRLPIFALALLTAVGAHAASTALDPRGFRPQVAGPPTQVLTIGTPHISQIKGFKVETLDPLLTKLAAYKPTVITVESVSGTDCDMLRRYSADYADAVDSYCAPTDVAEKATGLTVPQAAHAVRQTLVAWPAAPSAGDRRKLAALFAAAGERPSAMVQWLRLPPAERHPGDGIDAALAKQLDASLTKINESYQIGAALAARLGLERVYNVDDHSADIVTASLGEPFEKAVSEVWSKPTAAMLADREAQGKLTSAAAVLAYYRAANAPAALRSAVDGDFGGNLRHGGPGLYGRQYVAWWEVRNLRMAANIRAAFGNQPGARVLAIVGASHKPYFDAYLDMMSEVRLVDAEAVLR